MFINQTGLLFRYSVIGFATSRWSSAVSGKRKAQVALNAQKFIALVVLNVQKHRKTCCYCVRTICFAVVLYNNVYVIHSIDIKQFHAIKHAFFENFL